MEKGLKMPRTVEQIKADIRIVKKDKQKAKLTLDEARGVFNHFQFEYNEVNTKLNDLEVELEKAEKPIRISDHAVIRYLERKHGFDFNKVRDEILDDDAKTAIKMGAVSLKKFDGKFKIKENCIVTYVGNKK